MESKNWSGLGISALISLLECRCHSGVTFWTGGGGSKSASGYGSPLRRFGSPALPNFPFKHRLYHIW